MSPWAHAWTIPLWGVRRKTPCCKKGDALCVASTRPRSTGVCWGASSAGCSGIITGEELVQNHRLKTMPGRLEDAVVHRRLVSKKGAKRVWGAVGACNCPCSCPASVVFGQLPAIGCPARHEHLRRVHEPGGERSGHRDCGRPIAPVSQVPPRGTRVAWRAVALAEARRALWAQGQITQLVTAPAVWGVGVQARFQQPPRALLGMVVWACGLSR